MINFKTLNEGDFLKNNSLGRFYLYKITDDSFYFIFFVKNQRCENLEINSEEIYLWEKRLYSFNKNIGMKTLIKAIFNLL